MSMSMTTLSADQILKITKVGQLFTNSKKNIKSEYINLCKQWHPDHNSSPSANLVMTHINVLYDKALSLINQNKWEGLNLIRIPAKNNKAYEIKYYATYQFELGSMYINDNIVLYLLDKQHEDFYQNALKQMESFKFASPSMKTEMSKYLPVILELFKSIDNQFGMIIQKTPDLLLLQDVLNHFDNKIDDKHVAWIMSSLYNITCYFDYMNIAHNGITTTNYFISPLFHGGALLGGWWYAKEQNKKMIGVPKDIYNILPPKTKDSKLSNITSDLESIRNIGKKLLGKSTAIPSSFSGWLKLGASEKAIEEYSKWNESLNKSYGKRKFIVMNLTSDLIYKK